jgi:hypothetical protein
MSQVGSTTGGISVSFDRYQFEGEDVSWVGECPWNEGFCYGTESGKLLVPVKATPDDLEVYQLVDSGEAINGVAFHRDDLAASTREEVVIYPLPFSSNMTKRAKFDGGAHGVVACSKGGFVAPLGSNGLLWMGANERGVFTTQTFITVGTELDFYKIIRLGEFDQADHFVCAVRENGLLTLRLSDGDAIEGMGSIGFPGLDLVDVCGLRSPERPFGVAGLGIDGTILLMHNVQEATRPQALRLAATSGTPYTILCVDGHLLVLTSTALIFAPDLITRFLAGEPLSGGRSARIFPMQAVDAYLVCDRLVLILPDCVESMPIDQLPRRNTASPSEMIREIIDPPWELSHPIELTQVPA